MTDNIEHLGTVEHINGRHIQVRIVQKSACSACAAKSLCHSSESKEKMIDVYDSDAAVQVGDEVVVYGTVSMGLQAVVLAFVVPFIVLIAALFVAFLLTAGNELVSGVVAMLTVIPYYIVLYFLRHKLTRKFSFTIKPNK